MNGQYSLRSPAVKRLMKEAQELREPTEQYHTQPLEDNLFEWHFTIRGPLDSEFNGGIYHGRIILPPEYPMKPPSIVVLTSNGRFETHTKICLSISGHHPESWQPSWSIRTALLAIIGFMPTHGGGAIGSLDYTADERKRLAKKSLEYKCPVCGCVNDVLRPITDASIADSKEAKELASQINFQGEKQKDDKGKSTKKPQDGAADDNTATSPSATSPSATSSSAPTAAAAATSASSMPQNPTFPNPPWGQMPFYNPYMPYMQQPIPPGTRPPNPNTTQQTRPFMAYAQFATMQSMMQQMQQAGRSGPMGFGSASRIPGAMPTIPGAMPTIPGAMPTMSGAMPTMSGAMPGTVPTVSVPQSLSSTTIAAVSQNNTISTSSTSSEGGGASTTTTESKPTSKSTSSSTSASQVDKDSTTPAPITQQPLRDSPGPENVRQRTATPSNTTTPAARSPPQPTPSARPPAPSTPVQPADLRTRTPAHSPSALTKVVMAMLAVAILMLVLRRLSIMGILKFDQDAEL